MKLTSTRGGESLSEVLEVEILYRSLGQTGTIYKTVKVGVVESCECNSRLN